VFLFDELNLIAFGAAKNCVAFFKISVSSFRMRFSRRVVRSRGKVEVLFWSALD
jgi:hypothetical protein